MKKQTTFLKSYAAVSSTHFAWAALLVLALMTGCGGAPGSLGDSPADAIFSDASQEAQATEMTNDASEMAVRRRYVRVNPAALARAISAAESGTTRVVKFNLFDGEEVTVVLEDIQRLSSDNLTATGRIVGDSDSAVTLVLNKEVLLANVRRGDEDVQYEVRYVGRGLHKVRELPPNHDDEDCLTAESPDATSMNTEKTLAESIADSRDDVTSPLVVPRVDIVAGYTPAAMTKAGGTTAINALIQLGIADTNRALADSGVSMTVRLVGTVALARNETGNFSTDLTALRSKTDGKWDEIHTARAKLGADQVSLVVASPSGTVAGIGYVNATYSSAFTITRTSAFKAYSFSHELGHNLGLNHRDGYNSTAGNFRTIIAYGTQPRARRYSNPALTYLGYKTGDSTHNEAKILNANSSRVAGLVTALVP